MRSYGKRFVDGSVIRRRMAAKDTRINREQAQQNTVTDFDMAEAMRNFGGSFAIRLADLWQHADEINRAKILAAWPDECEEYRELVRLQRRRGRVPV